MKTLLLASMLLLTACSLSRVPPSPVAISPDSFALPAANWQREGQTLRKLRMPSPDAVWTPPGDDAVELLSFNGTIARVFDRSRLALGPARRLPKGKGAFVAGDRAWIVRGTDRRNELARKIRAIDGNRVAEVSLPTGEVTQESPSLPTPLRVSGRDTAGRVLVLCEQDVVLLDATTPRPVLDVRHRWGAVGDVAMLSSGMSAAVFLNRVGPERLAVLEWRKGSDHAMAQVKLADAD